MLHAIVLFEMQPTAGARLLLHDVEGCCCAIRMVSTLEAVVSSQGLTHVSWMLACKRVRLQPVSELEDNLYPGVAKFSDSAASTTRRSHGQAVALVR